MITRKKKNAHIYYETPFIHFHTHLRRTRAIRIEQSVKYVI